MRTDPKNATYECVSGLRRKVEDYEAAPETTGQIRLDTEEQQEKLATDAFFKLEHQQRDQTKSRDQAQLISDLHALNQRQWSDPYTQSRKLRQHFRDEKKQRKAVEAECQGIQDRLALSVTVDAETEADVDAARRNAYVSDDRAIVEAERKRALVESGLFDESKLASSSSSSAATAVNGKKTAGQLLVDAELKRRRIVQSLFTEPSSQAQILKSIKSVKSNNRDAESSSSSSANNHGRGQQQPLLLVDYGSSDDDGDGPNDAQ